MVMALGEITKEGINRWFHKLIKNLYIKNSIYFAQLVHRQEYRNVNLWFVKPPYDTLLHLKLNQIKAVLIKLTDFENEFIDMTFIYITIVFHRDAKLANQKIMDFRNLLR
jgi:hypothetical protein